MIGSACPCGSTLPYDACCGPLHRGARQAMTAVELMRSRYAAYAVGGAVGGDYVFRTWHPRTRPAELSLEGGPIWVGLTVEEYGEDWVDYTATWTQDGEAGMLREHSRFEQRAGRWFYLDGDIS